MISRSDYKLDSLMHHKTRRSVVASKPPLEYYIGKKSEFLFILGAHSLGNIQWKLICKSSVMNYKCVNTEKMWELE